jgi:hypothetical protein
MIFINMVFTIQGYEKLINYVIPRKFKFVDKVEIIGKPYVKYGTLHASFLIYTKTGMFNKMKDDCKKDKSPGFRTTFWGYILCLGKNYNLIEMEKEFQILFNTLNERPTVSRVIKSEFIVN